MKLFNTLLAFITFLTLTTSCQKTTNRGVEIEYRTDTIFGAAAKDTTFIMDTANWNALSFSTDSFVLFRRTTYLNTSEGIKLVNDNPHTGSRLQTKNEVYFKDKTIYYKWKVNTMGG